MIAPLNQMVWHSGNYDSLKSWHPASFAPVKFLYAIARRKKFRNGWDVPELLPVGAVESAVGDGFGDVPCVNTIAVLQVGHRTGDT